MNEQAQHNTAGSVLLASLMLPGLATLALALPSEARAESPPEKSTLSLKYGNYQDSESGWTSVTVNAAQGNPHQPDINFRGFAASPLLGTPQGLSVYVDGVRVNQPFGDVL